MTNLYNEEHDPFVDKIKIELAKKHKGRYPKIDVFWSDQECEYYVYINGKFGGHLRLDNYDLEE